MPSPSTVASGTLITGTCQQLLFSPKGGVEGLLLKAKGKLLQITFKPDADANLATAMAPGKRLQILAAADQSPKTQHAAHPVYQFEAFADAAGLALAAPDADATNTTVKGVVAALHYARHGQPNGVVLDSGDFIHMRPHGMAQVGLGIGAKVSAVGALRTTVLGTRLLEARQVNRIALD